MTPMERSKQIIAEIGRYSTSAEILNLIEPAIIAAIAEERESCATVADKAAEQLRMIAAGFPLNSDKELKVLSLAAEVGMVGRRIRARSQNDQGEPVELIGAIRDDE